MKQPTKPPKAGQKKAVAPRQKLAFAARNVRLIAFAFFGLFSFSFLTFYYGEVLKLAEECTLFLCDYSAMNTINQSGWSGIPYYLGRFLLQLFHFPAFGALVTTVLLLASSVLIYQAVKRKPVLHVAALLVPSTFFLYLVYHGFGLFHLTEPSLPFVYLIGLLVASLILGLVARLVSSKAGKSEEVDGERSLSLMEVALPSLSLLIVGSCAVVYPRVGMNIITHSRMMNGAIEGDWDLVEKCADKIDHHTRSTAAFNAIALFHKGQIANKLFKKSYRYPMQVTKTSGTAFHETMLYYSMCTYHAGLTHCAYYKAMECATINGFSPFTLKILAKCALLHGEYHLAEKYLYVLSQTFFHKAFAEKYMPYTRNEELINSDPEFAVVRNLAPIEPLTFIQYYREPIFLGYNITLSSGRSLEALHLSLAACLYGKQANSFMERAEALDPHVVLPIHYQEAIYLFSVLNGKSEYAERFNINMAIKQKTISFLSEYDKLKEDKFKARDLLEERYVGTYAYYYLLENLPEESQQERELHKKGVN